MDRASATSRLRHLVPLSALTLSACLSGTVSQSGATSAVTSAGTTSSGVTTSAATSSGQATSTGQSTVGAATTGTTHGGTSTSATSSTTGGALSQPYPIEGLTPIGWTITDEYNGADLTSLADHDTPATASTVSSNPSTGVAGMLIDLGAPTVVDRIYVTGPTTFEGQSTSDGNPQNWAGSNTLPLGMINVYVGSTAATAALVAQAMVPYDAGNPVDTEADLRFQPVVGRYIRVELQTGGIDWFPYFYFADGGATPTGPATLPWAVGEIEVHGFAGQSSITKRDAVVLPANAAAAYAAGPTNTARTGSVSSYQFYIPLITAANDLSYYLGKLEGSPVPIITAAEEPSYPGTIYAIEDLQPSASTYATMIANETSGLLPADISVVAAGQEVQFSGWPYRNVLKSVWTFLAAQGIHWVYPTPHGDDIPVRGTVDVSMLPLSGTSVALPGTTPPHSVLANWPVASFLPWYSVGALQTQRQGYLNLWRAGWNTTWGGSWPVVGGPEIPAPVPTSSTLSSTLPDDYSTQFVGYPDDFANVIPEDVLNANPTWCGLNPDSGLRVCSGTTFPAMAFDMTNPEVISWVANKMTAVAAYAPQVSAGNEVPMDYEWYGLLPMDATDFDQGPNSLQANSASATSVVPIPDPIPWVHVYGDSQSGAYYSFVNQVALQVQQQNPVNTPIVGALAYSDVFLPPPAWEVPTLASNTRIEVVQYGEPNLPISTATAPSSPNYAFKQVMDQWHALTSASGSLLCSYDYVLLLTDYAQPDPQLPVPAVAAIVDKADYLANIEALEGGTQGNAIGFPYNPWDFYAYPRVRQNLTLTAAQIEEEFFTSYFREAAAPMLAYYQAMESWQVQNNAGMWDNGYALSIMPGTFPNQVLYAMSGALQSAQTAAQSWIVKKRVADMAAGFNWILTNLGLQASQLNDTSPYQAVGQDGDPVSLQLQNGITSLPYIYPYNEGNASNGKWAVAGGEVFLPVYFAQGGTYTLTIVAAGNVGYYGVDWGTPPPQLTVYLGPQNLGTLGIAVPAADAGYSSYELTATVPADYGVQQVWVQDRNGDSISIDSITLTRTGG